MRVRIALSDSSRLAPVEVFEAQWKKVLAGRELPKAPLPLARVVSREINPRRALKVLEVGSGRGVLSAELAQLGADVTLLDASPAAVHLSTRVFAERGLEGRHVMGDLFRLPFAEGVFDVVWSSGVLEHFGDDLLEAGLREMGRVCSRKGRLVVLVPSSRAVFYRLGKWITERQGKWRYGFERPLSSLRPFAPQRWRVAYEYQVGVAAQAAFLPCPLGLGLYAGLRIFCDKEGRNRFLEQILGGYLLVSVMKWGPPARSSPSPRYGCLSRTAYGGRCGHWDAASRP